MILKKPAAEHTDRELIAQWREVLVCVSDKRAFSLQQRCAALDETEKTFVAVYEEMRQRSLLSVNLPRRLVQAKAPHRIEVAARIAAASWSGGEPAYPKDATVPIAPSER